MLKTGLVKFLLSIEIEYQSNTYIYYQNFIKGNTSNSLLMNVDCAIYYLGLKSEVVQIRIIAIICFPIICIFVQYLIYKIITYKMASVMKYFKRTIMIIVINFFLPSFLT